MPRRNLDETPRTERASDCFGGRIYFETMLVWRNCRLFAPEDSRLLLAVKLEDWFEQACERTLRNSFPCILEVPPHTTGEREIEVKERIMIESIRPQMTRELPFLEAILIPMMVLPERSFPILFRMLTPESANPFSVAQCNRMNIGLLGQETPALPKGLVSNCLIFCE